MNHGSHLSLPSGKMMESASHITITGGSFVAAQSNITSIKDREKKLKALYNTVSLNAILNSGGRADPVRCFPGTREEVMARIEMWMDDQDSDYPIFWLSGPAGAGKSAIAQTIAERCLERSVTMVNFFFFRSDDTRSHARPLVATLLYQIFDLFPDADSLKARVEDTIVNKPLVFNASVEQQFKDLMYHVVDYLRGLCEDCRKIVVIIDGLDECAQENQATQQSLLRALYALSVVKNSSLKIFIGSRADPHLIMAFNELPSAVTNIFLDADNYHPSDDIRNMVTGQFEIIKNSHHLSWTLDNDWPPPADIEEVVTKSSGQFIYAATVMRYIASSPESPSHSLERVKGIRPVISNSPFAALDAIYTHILSCVRDWESAKDLLSAHILTGLRDEMFVQFKSLTPHRAFVFKALGYAVTDIPSYLSDLTSLLQFSADRREIVFYHTSLVDFLLDRVRSGVYFIDLAEFRIKIVPKLFNSHLEDDEGFWHVSFSLLSHIERADTHITEALLRPPITGTGNLKFIGTKGVLIFVAKLKLLYSEEQPDIHRRILTIWLTAFLNQGFLLSGSDHASMEKQAANIWGELNGLKVENVLAEGLTSADNSDPEPEDSLSDGKREHSISEEELEEELSEEELDQAQDIYTATRLLPVEVQKVIAGIEGFRSDMTLARMSLKDARQEVVAAQEDAQATRIEASATRVHVQTAHAEIEAVRWETETARKALSYVWAEVGRAANECEAVRAKGQAEADVLRAEVESLGSKLRALRAELVNIQASNDSWSKISRNAANGSTLFLCHSNTSGDGVPQWIVI
ncbi:hypothetical protein D9619_011982 [Psilocybe cf. subviscida]|uniref:NACHT domain-containing protein n=1 Tax=Psilocybe cf. subviscida TaxID=2480587 RepID=A0A8H5EVW9_9AGAR|nr:hypothetical protein D9619_011982 [Psilocybe cf. subviscida]